MGNNQKKRNDSGGVNNTLLEWATGDEYINEILKSDPDSNGLLVDIFSDNAEKRELASISFYQMAWGYYPELGPNPMIEILSEFEHDRIFYQNYRDHTTHIIKTFILGLYFYDQVLFISDKIDSSLPKDLDKKAAFREVWTITVLYHDIGYIFENEEIERHMNEWTSFKNKFNEMLGCPLTCVFSGRGMTREKERSFIKANKIYMVSIDSIGEVEAESGENEKIWDILYEGGTVSRLGNDSVNGIHKYYEFASKKKTVDGRPGYMDHGICSALLLGKVWYAYSDYLKKILNEDYDVKKLAVLEKEEIVDLCGKLDSTESLLRLALNAVALHNVNKEIWNMEEAISHQVYLNDFHMNFSALPLACLMRLCDELQMWDRNRYRKPQPADKIITGRDLDILASDGVIYLYFESDNDFTDPKNYPHSAYNTLYQKLSLYLDKSELDKILICGKPAGSKKSKPKVSLLTTREESIDEMETEFQLNTAGTAKEEEQWLVGALNLDEDVHFSSFYLRQSMEKNLPKELKQFGYHEIIAVYEDYNEIYYVSRKECVEAARHLIDHVLNNWNFGEDLLHTISEKINVLGQVFKDLPQKDSFQGFSNEQLLGYYEKHQIAHTTLYVYARIPEVLDRGVPTFTKYLKDYLRVRSDELKEEEKLNEIFDILTYPEMIGYSGENILDICDVINLIEQTSTEEEKQLWKSSNGRFLIRMKPEVVQRIEEYTNKWTYWGYHGYRNRVLKDFNYFAEKLRLELTNKEIKDRETLLIRRQDQAASRRMRTFAKYNIEEKYQGLFRFYSQIGTIKLKRRYCQLMNFYYLDQLLFEIAKRFRISESVIRCMLPDEIIRLLRGDRTVLKEAQARETSKLFVYHLKDESEKIVYGSEAEAIAKKMKDMVKSDEIIDGELFGEVASMGTYRGVCRVIDKVDNEHFEQGEILVATDIDPDKFELLKLAGAVLTETGGFTCHAAIVCRELRIPCIVGIHDLIQYVHTGQSLDIDAGKGKVKILTNTVNGIIRMSDFDEETVSKNEIGAKAYSLFQLNKAGFSVPSFFCVRIDSLKEVMLNSNLHNEQNQNSLIGDIQNTLNEMNNEWWAVRSSTNREDGEEVSGAGQEITMLRVHRSDVIQELARIINGLKDYSGGGSIILQKMILGSYSGVIFTDNPVGGSNELVIQAVPGGNEYLTSGQINPANYVYRKDKLEFDEAREGIWKNLLSDELKDKLKEKAMQIEEFFGTPQDIEWTAQEKCIYFLQSRKITKGYKSDKINIFSANKSLTVDTLSIYQSYALPVHLRNHLLKTAAIVCWIMDHWTGEELNEEVMIKASLLHDIGNIVKGTDDKFKFIFPDVFSEECWQYWLNVRTHIGERYGKTDLEATLNIAKEINVGEEVLKLIEEKQFCRNKEIFNGGNFEVKICAYADQRVSPNGILSLEGRLDEARTRHRGIPGSSVNSPNYEALKRYAGKIETQIFQHVNGSPEDINDKSVERYIMGLKAYEF